MNMSADGPVAVAYLHGVAAVLGAIAWPLLAVFVLVVFRKPIREALEHLIEFRLGDATLKFNRAAAEVSSSLIENLVDSEPNAGSTGEGQRVAIRERYGALATENPLSAILKAYSAVEMWFDRALLARGIENREGARKHGVSEMATNAVNHGLLPKASLEQIEGLTILRDLADARPVDQTTSAQAREFLLLVDGVLYALDSQLAKTGPTQ